MEAKEYLDRLQELKQEIRVKELYFSNLREAFKREHAFMEGDRVELIKGDSNYNYFLIVDVVWFDDRTLEWNYRFAYITPTGKKSEKKCTVYYDNKKDTLKILKNEDSSRVRGQGYIGHNRYSENKSKE